jgi:hypothetical protein
MAANTRPRVQVGVRLDTMEAENPPRGVDRSDLHAAR